ncbi:MAG: aldehyde ferredoxin oxidoreductase [Deltaproteobacteria bacterium]|nr:aldehyde ferredoxin oxidoreductase [Deltaproteobacteria bacterium]
MGKIMRVNLSELKFKVEEMPTEYQGLGGRGLSSNIIGREVPPKADPLGPENKLIFSAGILAGTATPNTGRLSVGAKSPLTNGIKEANAGGSVAQKLARLGFQAVIIEGCAKELTMLKVDQSGATFSPASSLKGVGNYELIERMKKEHGNKISIISIGPAGEMKLKAASVTVTTPDFHIRVAARGGLGAVMGSKNLKAVIIDDTGCHPVEAKDKAKFKEAVAALSKAILADPLGPGMRDIGTPVLVMMINSFGCFPTKNYSLGQFEGAEKVSGEYMIELMKKRPNAQPSHRCMEGCIISCSNVYTDEKGKVIVSGIEYETIGLMGSNCMIDDLDTIAHMNRVCNDVGVDTMDIGGAIAVAMEAGQLAWGDGKAALSLVKEIGKTDRGIMIGNGCRYTGEKLGVKRIPHVKGQCLSAYDPRGLKGVGVTYATSPMGADHTAGLVLPNPGNPSYNPGAPTGQGGPSQFMQSFMAAADTLGLCMMAGMPLLDPVPQSTLISCVSAFIGESLNEDYLVNLGTPVLKAERKFNNAAGFTEKDDRLPKFFVEEKLPPSGNIFDVPEEEIDSVNKF